MIKDCIDTCVNTRVWLFNTKWLPKPFQIQIFIHIFHSGVLAMHDHSSWWMSIPLWGGYWERTLKKGTRWIRPGHIRIRNRKHFHEVSVDASRAKCAITIWILGSEKTNDWHFMHADGTVENTKDYYKRVGVKKYFKMRRVWGFRVGKRTFVEQQ